MPSAIMALRLDDEMAKLRITAMNARKEIPEDQLVWSFFGRKTTGVFVEVGAILPHVCSQTWLLEQNGWRGILIEPQEEFYKLLRQERKNSLVWRAACSSPGKRGAARLYWPADHSGMATLEMNVDDFYSFKLLPVKFKNSNFVKML